MAFAASATAQPDNPVPPLETIVIRMAEARTYNEARFQPFAVTRDYRLFADQKQTPKSQVIAEIVFSPPDLKSYTIRQTSGTGIGERIVRRMLASEVEIAKNDLSTDFSSRNYEFRFVRPESVRGRNSYVIELIPRRKDRNLICGNIWIDAKTYLPLRADGKPAKNPSFWVKDVHIALSYEDVEGMWLQTSLEATANVRMLGAYRLVSRDMRYQITPPLNSAQNSGTGP